jgi:lipopolysaccharide/colanic/teichoic acid biosynthesis glycosyltransferase
MTDALDSIQTIMYTATGCAIASLVGLYLMRNVRNYPGVEEYFYIFPAFCAAYVILIVVLILARIPYSRFLLTGSFVANVSIFIVIYVLLRRQTRLRIGVVAVGEYARLIETPGVDWRLLENPETPVDDFDSVSVDLWCDLSDEWERKLASFAVGGVPVYHSKHLRESLTGKVEIERLSENHFGTLSPLYAYMTVKHAADWIAALVALIILLPFLALTGVLIRLDSPGPVIFRQVRVGYQGRPFRVFKFRTMTVAWEEGDTVGERRAAMTQDNDQRITRLGRFLRSSRIDELPQLLNVLKGEMSWIGPRPEAEVLSRWYESEIPFYRYRHIVRPGITGWAQVNQGHVSDVDQVREKLHFDFYYIKNFSLWIDIIVVARTIRTMLTGFGSR